MGAGSVESPPRGRAVNSGAMRASGKGRWQGGRDSAGTVRGLCGVAPSRVRGALLGSPGEVKPCVIVCAVSENYNLGFYEALVFHRYVKN